MSGSSHVSISNGDNSISNALCTNKEPGKRGGCKLRATTRAAVDSNGKVTSFRNIRQNVVANLCPDTKAGSDIPYQYANSGVCNFSGPGGDGVRSKAGTLDLRFAEETKTTKDKSFGTQTRTEGESMCRTAEEARKREDVSCRIKTEPAKNDKGPKTVEESRTREDKSFGTKAVRGKDESKCRTVKTKPTTATTTGMVAGTKMDSKYVDTLVSNSNNELDTITDNDTKQSEAKTKMDIDTKPESTDTNNNSKTQPSKHHSGAADAGTPRDQGSQSETDNTSTNAATRCNLNEAARATTPPATTRTTTTATDRGAIDTCSHNNNVLRLERKTESPSTADKKPVEKRDAQVSHVYSVTTSFSEVSKLQRVDKGPKIVKKPKIMPTKSSRPPSAVPSVTGRHSKVHKKTAEKGSLQILLTAHRSSDRVYKPNRQHRDVFQMLKSTAELYDPLKSPLAVFEKWANVDRKPGPEAATEAPSSGAFRTSVGEIMRSSVSSLPGMMRRESAPMLRRSTFSSQLRLGSSVSRISGIGSQYMLHSHGLANRTSLTKYPRRTPTQLLGSSRPDLSLTSSKDVRQTASQADALAGSQDSKQSSSLKVKISTGKSEWGDDADESADNRFGNVTQRYVALTGPRAVYGLDRRIYARQRARFTRLSNTKETPHDDCEDYNKMTRAHYSQDCHYAFTHQRIPALRKSPAHIMWPIRHVPATSKTFERSAVDLTTRTTKPEPGSGQSDEVSSESDATQTKDRYGSTVVEDIHRGAVRVDQHGIGAPRFYPWAPFNPNLVRLVQCRVMQAALGPPLPHCAPTPPLQKLDEVQKASFKPPVSTISNTSSTSRGRFRQKKTVSMPGVENMFKRSVTSRVSGPTYYGIKTSKSVENVQLNLRKQ